MTLAHDVSDALSSDLARRIAPTFGYYRQPNGWLTISPNTRLERLKYTEQGWTYLDAYGAFDMTAYTANHPFEGLFMFGGAKEMSVQQILETGLYIDPPKVPTCRQHLTQYHRSHTQNCWRGATPVEFPQLATVPKELLGPFVCDFCSRKMPTRVALKQHQSVAHTEPLGNVQMGRSLGDALALALKQQPPSYTQMVTETTGITAEFVVQQSSPVPPRPMYRGTDALVATVSRETCGCGGEYKKGGAHFHKRSGKHKAWEATQVPATA